MGYNTKSKDNLRPFTPGPDSRRNLNGRPVIPGLNEAIAEVIGPDGVREIIKALYQQAQKGNIRAIEILLGRIYGKSKEIFVQDTDPFKW